MFTIHLNNLQFFSFHGIHEEERVVGNEFEVNASLSFVNDEPITTLEQTINYVSVYEIIKRRMYIETPLLETLVQNLAEEIHGFDNRIKSISVSVEKKKPPMANMEGSVSVHYKKDF